MRKCSNCGAELPENSRFCGNCGSVQDTTVTEDATSRSNIPEPYWTPEGGTLPASPSSYPYPVEQVYPATPVQQTYPTPDSQPAWSPTVQAPMTPPPPPPTEQEDERRGIPPLPVEYGAGLGAEAMMGGGQPYGYGAPAVQGTPQIGGVPSVGGSPASYVNAPGGNVGQGPAYQAPAGNVGQGPAYHAPISNYPGAGAGQPSTYYAPQQATPEAYPAHEPYQHSGAQAQQAGHAGQAGHLSHAAAGATKVAGTSALKTVIIIATTVVVVAAGGIAAAAHFLNQPQPVISMTSNFKVGSTYAGANGTVLHINGKKFSDNSLITFLLDGSQAPGNPSTHSDANGNFSTDMQITSAWSVGTHTLTARDASNYSTKNSVSVIIVQPGAAHTPGPNGAPPDDATFTINLSVKGSYTGAGNQPFSYTTALHTTGHPDPNGGTVCGDSDTGKQFTSTSTTLNNSTPFTETYALSCQGSYKGGQVTYTQMLLSAVITYTTSGVVCTMDGPHVNQKITGSYTSQNNFTGTLVYPGVPQSDFHCSSAGWSFYYLAGQGTWTGTVSGLQS